MNALIDLQNLAFKLSPGLLPLFAIFYSFVNSWHCMAMCGPLLAGHNKKSLDRFFLVRILSYTACGALAGFAGKLLRASLELTLINAIGFFLLASISLYLILTYLLPRWRSRTNSRLITVPALLQGFLFPLMPCHLLGFYYGISALSGSAFSGALLLFVHSLSTMPALAYSQKAKRWLSHRSKFLEVSLRVILVLLVILNLAYFTGRILHGGEDVSNKVLFCF